jgi:hypothetical protein
MGKDSTTGGGGADAPGSTDDSGGGSNTIDAPGPDASTAGISCGMMSCTTGCVTFANQMANYACIASGAQCQGLSQKCDGPEDCTNGDACCAAFNGGGGGGGGVACGMAGQGCRELCHNAGDCSQTGAMCCTSQFFNYSYCAMQCM